MSNTTRASGDIRKLIAISQETATHVVDRLIHGYSGCREYDLPRSERSLRTQLNALRCKGHWTTALRTSALQMLGYDNSPVDALKRYHRALEDLVNELAMRGTTELASPSGSVALTAECSGNPAFGIPASKPQLLLFGAPVDVKPAAKRAIITLLRAGPDGLSFDEFTEANCRAIRRLLHESKNWRPVIDTPGGKRGNYRIP